MEFETEWNPSSWTLDDSIPLRVYGKGGEYICEFPLNQRELESLHEAVQEAFFNLLKWNKRKSKYLTMTEEQKDKLKEYKNWEKEERNAQKSRAELTRASKLSKKKRA